jgi:hypothetical protein
MRWRAIGLLLAAIFALTPLSVRADAATTFTLLVSDAANRSNPVPLAERTVSGRISVFTSPDEAGIARVRFYLDNPSMTGTPRRTENSAPYDFAGGTVSTASAFDTNTVADGSHTITAAIDFTAGGTTVVQATFTVRNTNVPTLVLSPGSLSFTKQPGDPASSATTSLTTSDGSTASFALSESASWLTVSPASGNTSATVTVTVDAAGLSPGTYTTGVSATAPGYTSATLNVTLSVRALADQVHLAWVGDPTTTVTVVWHTSETSTPSTVEYRKQGETLWQQTSGARRTSGTTGTLHEAKLTSLTPGTKYEYRVRADGGSWGPFFTTRTAPTSGDVDFVYFADTGLIGRTDGLATGTKQVIDEIAKLNPLLLLGGGDYAYFDTDKRYGTLNNTIDAWFNQMQPATSLAPIMPVYGNHEILLSESYEPWAARFPTPVGIGGFDNRQNYSFDVGDVHFVAIMAVSDTAGLASSVLSWIDQDLQAAKNAGKRWLIPFFHVPGFGDGTNHRGNSTLRGQLGPIFEKHGVKLAIASHDQAYERSYPLVNVTSTGYSPTSSSKSCYTNADGVTWVKVSPAGKLSNINGSFASFATNPPPSWTAFRDNTAHHFARVTVNTSRLRFEAFGVKGDGSAPVIQDSFEYTTGSCSSTPALSFSPGSLAFAAQQGGVATSKTTQLATTDLSVANYTISENASWLTAGPTSGQTPSPITVTADPAGLAPGTYTATVNASGAGYGAATLSVSLTVTATSTGTYSLLVSNSSSRASPVTLAGTTVSGPIYVFTSPDTAGIARVRFYLDDPNMTDAPRQTERTAPYDFAGGSVSTATAFNSTTIGSGAHTITAAVDSTSGTTSVISASFMVSN